MHMWSQEISFSHVLKLQLAAHLLSPTGGNMFTQLDWVVQLLVENISLILDSSIGWWADLVALQINILLLHTPLILPRY